MIVPALDRCDTLERGLRDALQLVEAAEWPGWTFGY